MTLPRAKHKVRAPFRHGDGGLARMSEPGDPDRLNDLDKRLKEARSRQQAEKDRKAGGGGRAARSGMGLGFRLAVDIVAALVVGVVIGLLLDRWLGTLPLFLVLFFFMGGAAGILNAYRTVSGQGYAVGYRGSDDKDKVPDDKGEEGRS